MDNESYVASVQSELAERGTQVRRAVTIVRRIVRKYALFEEGTIARGSLMITPTAQWNRDKPNESVHLSLFSRDDKDIVQADITDMETKDQAVGSANFEFSEGWISITAMSIEVHPPNVRGHDDDPLTLSQLPGALADLQRYEDALRAGRVEKT